MSGEYIGKEGENTQRGWKSRFVCSAMGFQLVFTLLGFLAFWLIILAVYVAQSATLETTGFH